MVEPGNLVGWVGAASPTTIREKRMVGLAALDPPYKFPACHTRVVSATHMHQRGLACFEPL